MPRTLRRIEVSDDCLDIDAIERVVSGDGHYLGEAQTLALMKSEYEYPELGDRQSVADWIDAGSESIWQRAQQRVRDMLSEPESDHLSRRAETRIRDAFDIRLTGDQA